MRTIFVAIALTFGLATSELSAKSFAGYRCTDDCSGHIAGYEWAERHNIDDPDDCGGKSQSFIEGCRAYAMGEPALEDDDDDEDDDDGPP